MYRVVLTQPCQESSPGVKFFNNLSQAILLAEILLSNDFSLPRGTRVEISTADFEEEAAILEEGDSDD